MTPTAQETIDRFTALRDKAQTAIDAVQEAEAAVEPEPAKVINLDPKRPETAIQAVKDLESRRDKAQERKAAKRAEKEAGGMDWPQGMLVYKLTGGGIAEGVPHFLDEDNREGVTWQEAHAALSVLTSGAGATSKLGGVELVTDEGGYGRYARKQAKKARKAS